MRILITGGAGFIGSHLGEVLLARGHRVRVLDDLSTGSAANLAGCPGATLHVGTVLDGAAMEDLVAASDRVVHLAATVGVERVAAAPLHAERVIAGGARVVLGAAAARGVPVVSVSSSEVYGFAPRVPVGEDDVLDAVEGGAPRLAYVRAKLEADALGRALHAQGHAVLTVRPFNIIGPRQSGDGGAVLPRFVEHALRGATLGVHGDGRQRRTFLHVRDLAALLADLTEGAAWPHPVVNAGGLEECSILELARRVIAVIGSESRVECVDPPALRGGVEVMRRVPDLRRLRGMLDFTPRATLDDAIRGLAAEIAASAAA